MTKCDLGVPWNPIAAHFPTSQRLSLPLSAAVCNTSPTHAKRATPSVPRCAAGEHRATGE